MKKYITIMGLASVYFAQAQDVSVIQNSVDVYSNTQMTGSAKYNAMAGAMGALGGDVSVVNTNPAGLGVAIASDINATLSFNNNKNTTNFIGNSFGYKVNDTNLGQVGAVASFGVDDPNSRWKFMNIGINYSSTSLENYIESRANGKSGIAYDLSSSDKILFQRHAYDRVGDLSKMSIGIGGNLDNKWYFGTALNMHSANITQQDTAMMEHATTGDLSYARKQYTPYTEDASGFSMNFGVIAKLDNQFRVGLALETPTWWRIERAYTYYDTSYDGEYSELRNFSSPMKTTLSVAYVLSKNFAFNVDYILGITKPKYSTESNSVDREFKDFYKKNFNHLSEIRVGGEYRYQGFRARAGYAYASNPFDKMDITAFNTDGSASNITIDNLYGGERNSIGVGLGYDFKTFYIDAGYQYVSTKYKTSFLYAKNMKSYYFSDTYYFDDFNGDASAITNVKNNQNIFSITAGWKF